MLPFLTVYVLQIDRAIVCYSLGRCGMKAMGREYSSISILGWISIRPLHLFSISGAVHSKETYLTFRSTRILEYEDLNHVGRTSKVCDSP